MDGAQTAVFAVLAAVVAWQGLAIIGLARRLLEIERRQQGFRQNVLAYQAGDPVPRTVVGETTLGTPTSLALDRGSWLLIFATEGCSACGRATQAAIELIDQRDDLALAVMMPSARVGGKEQASPGDHEVHESWVSKLTEREAESLLMLPETDWIDWGAQGTPTAAIVQNGRLTAVDVGLVRCLRNGLSVL
jgi:hypothetical protein